MNVLILGLGSIGRRHARLLRELCPDARLFALRSGHGGAVEEWVADVRAPDDVPTPLDLAVIATPTDLHRCSVEKVLPLRPFLFLEKPLALTVAEGEEIARMVEGMRLLSYVGCHLRFHPCIRWVREELRTCPREMRSVRAVCRSWLPDWQPKRDYRQSFRADARRSGGVHLELIHELDYVAWVFGMPMQCALALRRVPELMIDAPSIAHYDLSYPGFSAAIDLSYASRERERTCTVGFGDGARWIIDLLAFTVRDAEGRELFHSPWTIDDVYRAQMEHVLRCVRGAEHSCHPVFEALKTLRLAVGQPVMDGLDGQREAPIVSS